MPTGNSPEGLSQRILAGIILVGRLGRIRGYRQSGVRMSGAKPQHAHGVACQSRLHGFYLCGQFSHTFNSLTFNSRVSDPRTFAYVHFTVPFESSNLPEAGHIYPD